MFGVLGAFCVKVLNYTCSVVPFATQGTQSERKRYRIRCLAFWVPFVLKCWTIITCSVVPFATQGTQSERKRYRIRCLSFWVPFVLKCWTIITCSVVPFATQGTQSERKRYRIRCLSFWVPFVFKCWTIHVLWFRLQHREHNQSGNAIEFDVWRSGCLLC
jgi:hypothetical protein